MRQPSSKDITDLALDVQDHPVMDAADRLGRYIVAVHDKAIESAVVVLLGKGLDLGFNPPHLNEIARTVKELLWRADT